MQKIAKLNSSSFQKNTKQVVTSFEPFHIPFIISKYTSHIVYIFVSFREKKKWINEKQTLHGKHFNG